MSRVTDVVITCCLMEGIGSGNIAVEWLNEWIAEHHSGLTEALKRVDGHAGGNKHMQCYVYATAVNYLNVSEFVEAFAAAPWDSPKSATLLLRDEQWDSFKTFRADKVDMQRVRSLQ